MGMTCIVEIIVFTPLVFFVPFPPLEIWYFIIASVILHGFYRLSVIYSYKFGDLSFVYPIARGGSSLLIVILTLIILQEHISLLGFVGISTVCIGIFLISYSKNHKFNFSAFILAASTALLIAIYTIVDGMGVRLSENKFSYPFLVVVIEWHSITSNIYIFQGKITFKLKYKNYFLGNSCRYSSYIKLWNSCMVYAIS